MIAIEEIFFTANKEIFPEDDVFAGGDIEDSDFHWSFFSATIPQ
jgi:hypothetical protein